MDWGGGASRAAGHEGSRAAREGTLICGDAGGRASSCEVTSVVRSGSSPGRDD
jgi:hypothetical protein